MAQLRSLSRPARAAPTRPAESSEDELLSSAADVAPTAKNAPSASHDRSSASPPPRGAPAGAAASAPSSRPAVTATRASARFVVADDSDSELSELSDRHDHLSDLDFEDAPEGVEEEESQEDEEEEEEDTEVLEDSSRRERGDGRRGRRKSNIDVKTDRAVGRRAASAAAASTDDRFQYVEEGQEPTDVVVSITPPSQAQREEFEVLPENDTVQSVWHEIRHSRRGGSRYLVGFVDGRVKEVSFGELINFPKGTLALTRYHRDLEASELDQDGPYDRRKRKTRMQNPFSSSDQMSVDGERAKRRRLNNGGSALRRSTRQTSYNPAVRGAVMSDLSSYDEILVKSAGRRTTVAALKGKLRSRTGSAKEDEDELSGDSDSSDFVPVYSDLLVGKPGRPGKGMKRPHPDSRQKPAFEGDDDIEYKTRRSGRSTRTRACMVDSLADEEMYAEDDKAPTAPRIASVKEVFQSLPANNEFRKFHMQVCDTCARGPNVGQFVYCQGCSATYHRACLGSRSTRDHLVTKIGEDNFVLQCRHCINITKATRKPDLSPARDMCQICREKGASCRPFSERLKPKEEERLRLENNGVDPITHVDEKLINNAETLLFRCVACHRGYHFEHLPTLPGIDDDRVDRQAKLTQYSRNWRCADCFEMIRKGRRVQTLVAWRPARPEDYKGEHYDDIAEDVKEYLIKWQGESYFHCTWLPGAWVWGVVPAAARKAFAKRAENAFPKMTSKEAIPEEYLLIDIVFRVQYKASSKGPRGSKEADFSRITDIKRAYVKFEGLGYDEAVWDTPPPRDSGEQWLAWEAAFADYLSGKYFESEPSHKIKERIKQYRSEKDFKNLELREQPKGLTAGNLMKYQLLGVNWMLNKFYLEKSAILADEMGLGKTIQVIGLIASLVQDNPKCWPFLIVVPNSTCPNWRREMKQWAPDLRVVAYHGGRQPQDLALKYELFPDGLNQPMKAHVVVMSYDSAQDPQTKQFFKSVQWVGLIVDEGQRLKNDQNLLYGALMDMKIPFRMLLTGTPLQNNKRELFNLLQFIDRSINAAELDEKYAVIDAEAIRELHDLIRPVFLRRTKLEVLKFLPNMSQIIVPVTMTILQEKLCKSIIAKNSDLIAAIFSNKKLKQAERSSLNNILMQLRKCLCHPFIYNRAVEEETDDPEVAKRNLISASGKLMLLEIMLAKLKEDGHRVLIFSQFLGQLDIVEDFLSYLGYEYERLDGNMSSLEKQKRIDSFNVAGSKLFAFLLSTRAGGVGINLATADTVIIMDPDFNPHQDLQALSRAHRIGQTKPVLCFQLMTKGTVEEKIMQIGRKKMALDHVLIEKMDDANDAGNDLESILKHGAEALFSDDEKKKEKIHYDAASVAKLLDRSSLAAKADETDKAATEGTSKFSLARVWANDEGELTDNLGDGEEGDASNPSVWENILKEREEQAQRLAAMHQEVLGRGRRRRQVVLSYKTNVPKESEGQRDSSLSDADEDFAAQEDGESSEDSQDEYQGPVPEDIDALGVKASRSRKSSAPAEAKQGGDNSKEPTAKKRGRPRKEAVTKDSNSGSGEREGRQDDVIVGLPALRTVTPVTVPTLPIRGNELPPLRDTGRPPVQRDVPGGLGHVANARAGTAWTPNPIPSYAGNLVQPQSRTPVPSPVTAPLAPQVQRTAPGFAPYATGGAAAVGRPYANGTGAVGSGPIAGTTPVGRSYVGGTPAVGSGPSGGTAAVSQSYVGGIPTVSSGPSGTTAVGRSYADGTGAVGSGPGVGLGGRFRIDSPAAGVSVPGAASANQTAAPRADGGGIGVTGPSGPGVGRGLLAPQTGAPVTANGIGLACAMFGLAKQRNPFQYYSGMPNPLLATTATPSHNPLIYNQSQLQARFRTPSSQPSALTIDPVLLSTGTSTEQNMQRDGQTTQNTPQDQLNTTVTPVNGAPAEENKLQFFCPTCKLPHKSNMPCPDFKSEIQVRIAIDSLRQAAQNPNNVISDPANYQFAMATLQERLRALARPPSDVS